MPRYTYKCENCQVTFQIIHSIEEKLTDCEECETAAALQRIPSIPMVLVKKQETGKRQVGSLVKEYIEDAKGDLDQEKRELNNRIYKDD